MPKRTYSESEIKAAFARLLAHAGQTCDAATSWAIAAAKDDVLDILTGDWRADEPQFAEAEATEPFAVIGAKW